MKAQCPTCGADVEFRYDDSFVRICTHCRSAVVRTDRGVESLGKTADLVDIPSPIKLFTEGRYRGLGFMVVGRTQLRHHQGGTWQEWYAKMDDGRWGWLAEAQGRYYLTFQARVSAPTDGPAGEAGGVAAPVTYDDAAPGARVTIEDDGPRELVINEKAEATYLSAEGEIPYKFVPGAAFRFVDLGDAEGRFATIDYGEPGSESASVYLGRQATLAELALTGGEVGPPPELAGRTVTARSLACPECNGPLELRAPDAAQRVACPYCGALLDASTGTLSVLRKLAAGERGESPIKLGSTCTFEGTELTAIGHVQRAALIDGQMYPFDEVLLHAPALGFRWLVCSDGHWSYVQPVLPAAVEEGSMGKISYGGVQFQPFQVAPLEVQRVVGEFYWQVEIGETVDSADYVAPPAMLSSERSPTELTWSLGRYVKPAELERAFGGKVVATGGSGVAPNQPSPFTGLGPVIGLALLAFGGAFLALHATSANRTVTSQTAQFTRTEFAPDPGDAAEPVVEAPPPANVWFSEPFELAAGENVAIDLAAPVSNSWVSVGGDLIQDDGGAGFQMFDRDIEYYFGVEDGESWSEGSQHQTVMLSPQPAGRYVLRLEATGSSPDVDAIGVVVRQHVFVSRVALYALIAAFAPALILILLHFSFERRRWQDSNTGGGGLYAMKFGDDDE